MIYEEISITDDETFQIHNFINDLSKYNICKQGSNFDKDTKKNLTKNILFTSYKARYSKYDTKNIISVLPTKYEFQFNAIIRELNVYNFTDDHCSINRIN